MKQCKNCKKIIEEYEQYLDDYKKEQRELVRQEFLEMIDNLKVELESDYDPDLLIGDEIIRVDKLKKELEKK